MTVCFLARVHEFDLECKRQTLKLKLANARPQENPRLQSVVRRVQGLHPRYDCADTYREPTLLLTMPSTPRRSIQVENLAEQDRVAA